MLNVITLVGRLTRDPELRRTNSGTSVGAFTVACDDGRKGPNGEKQTLFMDCTVFGPQADTLMNFWRKGNLIAVVVYEAKHMVGELVQMIFGWV